MLLGIALRWYSAAILGKYFTFDVAIQSGQTLVEAGPYRYVRHPSYTGALLTLFGFGLALGNWVGLAANLSCMGFAYGYRISVRRGCAYLCSRRGLQPICEADVASGAVLVLSSAVGVHLAARRQRIDDFKT